MVSSLHSLLCYVFRRLLVVLLLAAAIVPALADTADTLSESKVQAAFLYKFTSYVDWPSGAFEQADSPFVIGVMEDNDVANELARTVAGRLVNNRPVLVRRLAVGESPAGSHVLFIGSAVGARANRILAATKTQPILTVTEIDEGLSNGVVINFVVLDEQVRFDVSLAAAESSNLKISSRLLTVARKVIPVTP